MQLLTLAALVLSVSTYADAYTRVAPWTFNQTQVATATGDATDVKTGQYVLQHIATKSFLTAVITKDQQYAMIVPSNSSITCSTDWSYTGPVGPATTFGVWALNENRMNNNQSQLMVLESVVNNTDYQMSSFQCMAFPEDGRAPPLVSDCQVDPTQGVTLNRQFVITRDAPTSPNVTIRVNATDDQCYTFTAKNTFDLTDCTSPDSLWSLFGENGGVPSI